MASESTRLSADRLSFFTTFDSTIIVIYLQELVHISVFINIYWLLAHRLLDDR